MPPSPDKNRSLRLLITAVCVVLTAALWALDSAVPFEISMFVIYLIPIGVAAHFGLPFSGYLVALLSAIAWFSSNNQVDPRLHGTIGVWNLFTRSLVFFGLAAYGHLVSGLLLSQQTLRARIEELLATKNPLAAPQLVCERCQKIAGRDKSWVTPLDFVRQNAPEGLHACICPSCLGAFLSDKEGTPKKFS